MKRKMYNSFKNFLNKNADVIFTEGIPSEDTYISTRELGEWAFEQINKSNSKELNFLFHNIYLACLVNPTAAKKQESEK